MVVHRYLCAEKESKELATQSSMCLLSGQEPGSMQISHPEREVDRKREHESSLLQENFNTDMMSLARVSQMHL